MKEFVAVRDPKRARMHPGALLRDVILPAIGKPKTEIANLLGVSRQTLYDIITEKQPVTAAVAIRLGKLFGNGPRLWINLQSSYDIAAAEKKFAAEIEKIPTLETA